MVVCVLAMCAVPVCCAVASADQSTAVMLSPDLDKNFDVNLATTLIITFCSILGAVVLVIAVILAKRNIHN